MSIYYPFKFMPILLTLLLIAGCNDDKDKDSNYIKAWGTVTDIDGNEYTTVTIGHPMLDAGAQEWMAENLKTTKYNDGTDILFIDDATEENSTSGIYFWPNSDQANKEVYGLLYNGYAVFSGKLCPAGWHVSTRDDRIALTQFIGRCWNCTKSHQRVGGG